VTKYKAYFLRMLDENSEVFNNFKKLHDEYALNPDPNQIRFNSEGEKILEIVREYENRLCSATERGMYNKFSVKLAEKFQNEVRNHFPMIDHIGLIPNEAENGKIENFFLKKINLN